MIKELVKLAELFEQNGLPEYAAEIEEIIKQLPNEVVVEENVE